MREPRRVATPPRWTALQFATAYLRSACDCWSLGEVLRAVGGLIGERVMSLIRCRAVSFPPDWLDLYE